MGYRQDRERVVCLPARSLLVAMALLSSFCVAMPTSAAAGSEVAANADGDGLFVIVEATQRPLDGALVMPPACGPYKSACRVVAEVLHNDMRLSGAVRALELSAARIKSIRKYGLPNFEIHLAPARAAGVVYAIGTWLRKSRAHRGMVELKMAVFNVRTGQVMNLGRHATVSGPISRVRTLSHRAANVVFGAISGFHGSFDAQIFYSAPGPGCTRCIWAVDADGHNPRVLVGDKGIHMLPRQATQKGLFYVSFRTPLPSIFRLDGPEIDALLKKPTPRRKKARKRARKKRKSSRTADTLASVGPTAMATGKSLQFRTAAQNSHGRIAATINDGKQADIWLLGDKGQPRENLTKNDADDLDPSWSPDGTKLAFVSDRSGSPQIYVLTLGNKNLRRLTFSGRYNTGPDWGYNGKIVYSGLRGRAVDILTVDMHKSIQRLTPGKGRRSLEPSWAPCGRRVVYVSDEDNKGSRLWVASHDGAVRQPLALPGGRYYTPVWRRSPGQAPEPFQP